MSILFAAESWILAILGWVWLIVQEMAAWSLLGSHVVYGLLATTTFHLALTAVQPDNRQFKRAYFGSVLALTLYSGTCVLDTIYGRPVWGSPFKAEPGAGCCSNCNNARANKILFFTDSSLYLVQAGITLGYLVVHLLLAGAPMLDPQNRTLWPGPAFGTALAVLVAARLFIVFDGSTLTLVPGSSIYVLVFSMPLISLAFIYFWFMLTLSVLMAVEGLSVIGRAGLKGVRCATLGVLLLFGGVTGVVLDERRMLTPGLLAALVLPIPGAIYGVVEAFMAQETPDSLAGSMARQAGRTGARAKYYIPVPMLVEGGKKAV